jgi:hypothetical protein
MGVFLRWGVFGILGVAALLYAYNASKRMAEAHAEKATAPVDAPLSAAPEAEPAATTPDGDEPVAAAPAPPAATVTARCGAELQVARRAIEMKEQGEPLDRVLRIQEIAWETSPERRARLEKVATRWFGYAGDFSPDALRMAVVSDCEQSPPAP